jgi:hypothetical protein
MNIFYVFYYRQILLFWQEMKIRILIKCLIFLYVLKIFFPVLKSCFVCNTTKFTTSIDFIPDFVCPLIMI